jgi:TP901 family phage tail tape measure protein
MKSLGALKIDLTLDSANFTRGVADFNRKIRGLNSEFKAAVGGNKTFENSLEGLRLKSSHLSNVLTVQREKVDELRRRYEESAASKGKDAAETERLLIQYNRALTDLRKTEAQLENVNKKISEQTSRWRNLADSLQNTGQRMKDVGQRMQETGSSLTRNVTLPLLAAGGSVFKVASDFESAFAGVRKTVDATEEELANFRQGIRDMAKEIPASATEIATVAEAAGQLGIHNDALLKFTRTMVDLGVATNMTSDEAATALARLANITQMSQKDFDRLGSTVVALGNNLATTEREIVEMGLRLAGAGKQVGLTEAQILAFAGALSSVGIEAEAGGTAFSRVMITISSATREGGKQLETFAKVAGVSSSEFKKAFEQDAAGAIIMFIKGLQNMSKNGQDVFGVLEDLELSEIRVRDALLRASNASNVFNDSLEIGTQAWRENNALTKEASERYKTTESQLKILWNRVKDVGITLGDSLIPIAMDALNTAEPLFNSIERGAKAFSELDDETKKTIFTMAGYAVALGPVLKITGMFTSGIGSLISGTGTLIKNMREAKGTSALLGVGLRALTGPVGLAITGITLLSGLFLKGRDAKKKYNEVTLEQVQATQKEVEETDKLITRFEELQHKNKLTTDEMLRFMDLQDELKQASTPEEIEKIEKKMTDLQKKSGLTNEEMTEFLDLNGQIIEQSPATEKAISDQGNAYAKNTEEIKKMNAEKAKALKVEAEQAIITQLQKEVELRKKISDATEKMNKTDTQMQKNKETIIRLNGEIATLENQIKEIGEASTGEEYNRLIVLKQQLEEKKIALEIIKNQNIELGNQYLAQQKIVEKTNKEVAELEKAKHKYEEIILATVGLNSEKGKGLDTLQREIQKLEDNKRKLKELHETGKLTTQEYNNQVGEINKQIDRLNDAKAELEYINEVAGKTVYKKIEFSYSLKYLSELEERLSRPVYKGVHIRQIGPSIAAYAGGTDYHPYNGLALVGEEGPELVYLPKGAQVFTAKETKQMLSTPKQANNLNSREKSEMAINISIANMQVRDETDIQKLARELQNYIKMSGLKVGIV